MQRKIIIGIDPGLCGAVAIFSSLHDPYPIVIDTPTVMNGKKRDFNIQRMVGIVDGVASDSVAVALEKVWALPNQGVSSTFRFGRGYGIWEGIIYGLKYPLHTVSPQAWKKAFKAEYERFLSVPPRATAGQRKAAGKKAAVAIALSLYPSLAPSLSLVKHSDRAEALLIAEWQRRQLVSQMAPA